MANKKKGFIQAPRSIIFAQDLTSAEKVILLILIDKYLTLNAFKKEKGKTEEFYVTGKDFESKMDMKRSQVLKKYIPMLERKGFINKINRPEDKEGVEKTYSYFTLNWDVINNHKGDKKDEEVQAKRVAKGLKMRKVMEEKQSVTTYTKTTTTITETSTIIQEESEPQSFIDSITIQDDFEDDATREYRLNPDLYDAGAQWNEYQ